MTDPILTARRLSLIEELHGIGLACMITAAGAFHVFAAESGAPQLPVENLDKLPAPIAGLAGGDMQQDLEAAFGKVTFGVPRMEDVFPPATTPVNPHLEMPPSEETPEQAFEAREVVRQRYSESSDTLPEKCPCGCCHVPDYGACPSFESTQAPFEMCVYCDHKLSCHERDKERPLYNAPLGYGSRRLGDVIKAARKLKIGSMDCAGGCGRTVSANKGLCQACMDEAARRVTSDPHMET